MQQLMVRTSIHMRMKMLDSLPEDPKYDEYMKQMEKARELRLEKQKKSVGK